MSQKKIISREKLKNYFKMGKLPKEVHFEHLIDSTFNKVDDNLDVSEKEGLTVHAVNEGQLISFYDKSEAPKPAWELKFSENNKGLTFQEVVKDKLLSSSDIDDNQDEKKVSSLLFLEKKGNVGIGTMAPDKMLDVRGLIASNGRIGNYRVSTVPADGKWHNLFENKTLPSFSAFEIMASVKGKTEREIKYSLMHAIAISTLGASKPKINKTIAHYGRRWNRIEMRWESRPSRLKENAPKRSWWNIFDWPWDSRDRRNYNLQMRTRSSYGEDVNIRFKVSLLWDEDIDVDQEMKDYKKQDSQE